MMPEKVKPGGRFSERVFRAGWVVVSSSWIIRNGYVRTINGRIIETGVFSKKTSDLNNVHDLGSGIIFPGLINCHTHLELSFLKGMLDTSQGFRKWVQDLIKVRSETPADVMIKAARESLHVARDSGTAYIADISTLGLSSGIFSGSPISATGFHEFLGELPLTSGGPQNNQIYAEHCRDSETVPDSDTPEDIIVSLSFAAHAPHTTSPALMKHLKEKASLGKLPFCIHLDESDDEREFIKCGKGAWADFLLSRNIDFSKWPIPSESPVIYAEKNGILDSDTLCIHLCGASDNDLDIIQKKGTHVCLCPRSNINLHGILPDVGGMLKKGIKPCTGTDSLASVDSLSVFDELRFLYDRIPGIAPSVLFEIATINGADALGVTGSLGTLDRGKKAVMFYSGDIKGHNPEPDNESWIFDHLIFSEDIEVL